MRRILMTLILLLLTSPYYVEACYPRSYEGIFVEILDCNQELEIDENLSFDILVQKSDLEMIHGGPIISNGFPNSTEIEPILLRDALSSYKPIYEDWVSYTLYYPADDIPSWNYTCGARLDGYDALRFEPQIELFKVVAIDADYFTIATSPVYNKNISFDPDNQDKNSYIVEYDKDANDFKLKELEMDSSNAGCGYPKWGVALFDVSIYIMAIFAVFVMIFEPLMAYYKLHSKENLIVLININLLLVFVLILTFFGQVATETILWIIPIGIGKAVYQFIRSRELFWLSFMLNVIMQIYFFMVIMNYSALL